MIAEDFKGLIESMLFQVLGEALEVENLIFQGGGCINNGVKAETNKGSFFIKWNELGFDDMFEKEALGLELLSEARVIGVPKVYGFGKVGEKSFLVLEFIEAEGDADTYWRSLGEGLARLHQCTHQFHGLDHDNYIGRLVQPNHQTEHWGDFFIQQRLNVQAGLAFYNGLIDEGFLNRFKRFYERIPELIPASKPALLHGDLWSGNVLHGFKGRGYLIDPAVYYGCREMDLAMTHLFGGFNRKFYEAYQAINPLDSYFEARREVYNLYPLWVHVNLFGRDAGYLAGIEKVLRKYESR